MKSYGNFFWVGIISLLKKTNKWEQIVGRDREERQEPLFSGGRRGKGDSFITARSGLTVTVKRNSVATNSDGDGVSHRAYPYVFRRRNHTDRRLWAPQIMLFPGSSGKNYFLDTEKMKFIGSVCLFFFRLPILLCLRNLSDLHVLEILVNEEGK